MNRGICPSDNQGLIHMILRIKSSPFSLTKKKTNKRKKKKLDLKPAKFSLDDNTVSLRTIK